MNGPARDGVARVKAAGERGAVLASAPHVRSDGVHDGLPRVGLERTQGGVTSALCEHV